MIQLMRIEGCHVVTGIAFLEMTLTRFAIFVCMVVGLSRWVRADEIPVRLPAEIPVPVFTVPPRIATTRANLEKLKASPNFAAIRAETQRYADGLLANHLPLPDGYGGWIYDYACPDDGTNLQTLTPAQHQCPQCKKIYTDEKTIGAYRCTLHYAIEDALGAIALAAAYSGEERYTAEVKRVLLYFARAYAGYPDRRDRWGHTGELAVLGARRYVQSLDEAVGIIKLAKAYDLTRSLDGWTSEERAEVENNLFRATAKTLLRFNQGINNHQTWYDAGLLAIASVLEDAELVHTVLTMRGGYYDQLDRSVGSDGIWYEGTMAYQNYALQAVREVVDIGRNLGMKLYEAPKFRALLLAPLQATYPNGQFPAINDSDYYRLEMFDWSFAWGWELTGDPVFAQAMARDKPGLLKDLLGPAAKAESPVSKTSVNLADAGLAILRQGEGADAACVFLDYGQHGDGHGHYDKLNITLYANRREWLLDPGRLSYSHKEYKTWVKETAAHNTVVWDGKSQRATTGSLLWMQSGSDYTACAAQTDEAYEGVVLRRYLLLMPNALVDAYEVEASQDGQADLFAHGLAAAVEPDGKHGAAINEVLGNSGGYQHLTSGQKWLPKNATRWDFRSLPASASAGDREPLQEARLRVWLAGRGHEELFTANGIGYEINDKTPTLIRRRKGKSLRFVMVCDLGGKGDFVQSVKMSSGKITVWIPGKRRNIFFSSSGVKVVDSK